MALLDLSYVTETLVKLVSESILASSTWPVGQTPDVTSLPPDALDADNQVGIYLYHLSEDAALKNQLWPGRPQPPMRHSPMGLNLYYVVSAKSTMAASQGPYREQLLMGLAVKALHDWPIIDDATMIGSTSILNSNLRDGENKLRIELRHVPPNEAVSYWTAGANPMRLSVYYEVRVMILEPESPEGAAGRVLLYGVNSLIGGQPRLETSRNKVAFRIPGESADRVVEVQPASASPGVGATPGAEITFYGSNLTGDSVSLLIRALAWADPVALDPTWGVVAGGDRIFATPQTSNTGVTVLPGAYMAIARVVKTITRPDGTTGSIEQRSNQTPFTIVPAVTNIGAPVLGVFTVTGATFQHADLPPELVRVYVGEVELQPGTAGSLLEGRFAVTSPTTIQVRFPPGLIPGTFLPVRIVVNDAESHPKWVQVL